MLYTVLAIDYDGTLSLKGKPNKKMVKKMRQAYEQPDVFLVIHTARSPDCFKNLVSWLKFHDVPYHAIAMEKMRASHYIDDRNLLVEDVCEV